MPRRQNDADSNRGDESQEEEDENRPEMLDDNAPAAEWKELAIQLQLEKNAHKRRITELTRERDELETQVQAQPEGRPRRRRRRPSEPTPEDPKYELAGKRCALFWMLWVTPELFTITIEDTYSDALRYNKQNPMMKAQGERKDVLCSLHESCVPGFETEEHFQKVFGKSCSEQRRTTASRVRSCGSRIFGGPQDFFVDDDARAGHEAFKTLLGYRPEEEAAAKRYPAMAPVLYLDDARGNTDKLFKSKYIKKAFRAYLFGPSTLSQQPRCHKGGQQPLVKVLKVKTITPGAIAAAAVLTRWCISPDPEFSPKGPITGIDWMGDYQRYKKLLIEGLRAEKTVFDRTHTVIGPYTKLVDEWNTEFFPVTREDDRATRQDGGESEDDAEIAAALQEIQRFVDEN
ncbi:hypothetical protein FRC08_012698 [Ceratobasidium sp. 394]|nr:hypothetical protein FRC08_012698 [Ceratobasidium sp. 394]